MPQHIVYFRINVPVCISFIVACSSQSRRTNSIALCYTLQGISKCAQGFLGNVNSVKVFNVFLNHYDKTLIVKYCENGFVRLSNH